MADSFDIVAVGVECEGGEYSTIEAPAGQQLLDAQVNVANEPAEVEFHCALSLGPDNLQTVPSDASR
jgi:hypothetical protein